MAGALVIAPPAVGYAMGGIGAHGNDAAGQQAQALIGGASIGSIRDDNDNGGSGNENVAVPDNDNIVTFDDNDNASAGLPVPPPPPGAVVPPPPPGVVVPPPNVPPAPDTSGDDPYYQYHNDPNNN
jgi:hypothetical protein